MRPLLLVLVASGCDALPLSVTIPVGPLDYRVDTADLSVPAELEQGGQIRSLPCPPEGCPSDATLGYTSSCEAGVCDPVFDVLVDLGPVKLGDYGDLSQLGDTVSEVEIERAEYAVRENSLNVDLPVGELLWVPAGDTCEDGSLTHLGDVPPIGAAETPNGQVTPDAAGQQALADHLRSLPPSDMRFGACMQTAVDVAPGDPIPGGALRVEVSIIVHVKGGL